MSAASVVFPGPEGEEQESIQLFKALLDTLASWKVGSGPSDVAPANIPGPVVDH